MPALMTNTEFTAFLNTEAAARAQARTLANITRRAATLFTDGGYVAYQSPTFARLWTVTSPEGKSYAVRAASLVPGEEFLGDVCDCPCFAKHGTCKHLQAVLLNAEAEVEALEAQWEQQQEWANFCNGRFDR